MIWLFTVRFGVHKVMFTTRMPSKSIIWTFWYTTYSCLLFTTRIAIYHNMISLYSVIKSKLFVVLLVNSCHAQDFKGFDDTILYKINWPGKDVNDRLSNVSFINGWICILLSYTYFYVLFLLLICKYSSSLCIFIYYICLTRNLDKAIKF